MQDKIALSDQFEERLIDFAARIIRLAGRLPKNFQGRHVAIQILRSGTAGAPNYAEARGAESRADFIHKMRIVQKELNETAVWIAWTCAFRSASPSASGATSTASSKC